MFWQKHSDNIWDVLKIMSSWFSFFLVCAFVSWRRSLAGYVTDETWQNDTAKNEKRPKRRTPESVKLKSRIFWTFHHLSARFSVKSLIFHEIISIFAETIVSIMDYINEFHKAWIERTRQSIASWSKQPASSEEVRQQQERLNRQRAIREGKSKNWFHLLILSIYGLTYLTSKSPTWIKVGKTKSSTMAICLL